MGYRIGLVGKPSVGKSTFFNAATMNDVPEGAYHLHSDIGEGFLHGIDCREDRQVGADTVLDHRSVVEVVSTNQ